MGDGEAKAWPLRCPKPLEAVQELLIQYLSSGQGYDDESVSLALQEGNQLFQQKDFSRACDFFGIAYEIGRHHYCYRPLLHDLLLRRALCHSLLGNFKVAQQEIEKALWLIPHEATGLLVAALVYSKLGLVTEANVSFQQAVCSQRELKDLVDCLVAFFCLQHHYADRAVNICTQVLQRSPKCPLALLMRGDAYRFGPASRARQQSAAADYADLLELDFNYQALMCRQAPDPANHTRAEELLLSFHPTLQMQAPKPYHHYALYRHKDPLGVACMVVLAVTKLRLLSSSGKLIRRAQEAYEELLEQRAELQRKVQFLLQSQRQTAASPLAHEVYGPMDPENPHCRRYRRYWMEQAPRAPRPAPQAPPAAQQVAPQAVPQAPPAAAPVPQADVPEATQSCLRRQEAIRLAQQEMEANFNRAPMHAASASASPARPCDQDRSRAGRAGEFSTMPTAAPAAPPASPPELRASGAPRLFASRPAEMERREAAPAPEIWPSREESPKDADVAPIPTEPPAPATVPPAPSPAPSPKARPSEGMDEEQWLFKAKELLKSLGLESSRLPAKDLEFQEAFPSSSSYSKGLKSNKLLQKLEMHGLDCLQDWYTPLDRVHKVREMAICRASVEPPVAVSGLLGVPGHSYVVPRVHARVPGTPATKHRSSLGGSTARSASEERPSRPSSGRAPSSSR
ncbi:Catechol O-methyltransferase [Durusdinium trenchii]|uniref:Catechol O-methyltransferase n=1 Tax=Durusdinium trenchii TaxID=1381693 RepID=A0ABP0JMI2_9DINO